MTSFNQVNICTAVYHQCHSSACQHNTHGQRLACRHNTQNKAENTLKASVVGISNCIYKCQTCLGAAACCSLYCAFIDIMCHMPLPKVPHRGLRRRFNYWALLRSVDLCMVEYKLIHVSVFLFLAGKYGSDIRPAFWLNFVFFLVPVWGAVTLFRRPKDRPLIGGYNVSSRMCGALNHCVCWPGIIWCGAAENIQIHFSDFCSFSTFIP